MIGNDIVDFQLAAKETYWRRNGHLDKIFTLDEQKIILGADIPDNILWLFWSMKESAYKIYNRQTNERFYYPVGFICELNANVGKVTFDNQVFYTKSEVNENFVHTIAVSDIDDLNNVNTTFMANTPDYMLEFNSNSNTLEKDLNGIPNIIDEAGKSHLASVSHHGRYLSVVYLKNELKLV